MSDEAPAKLKRYGIGAAVLALAIVAIGIGQRWRADDALATVAHEGAVPTVQIVHPAGGKSTDGLVLPGNVQAFSSAAIYARTNGYVRRWLADIGDIVTAGQTLAVIDAPEVDQQFAQAQADYQTAAANQSLARTTAVRWDALLAKDAVSKQEADEKRGDLAAKSALANAQAANVGRLRALQGFTRLAAPFAGVVTSRSAQVGALVTAGNAAAQPLFTISDVRRVRIYVRVPQGYSGQIHPGQHAQVEVPEYAGRRFDAVITRSAGAVDPSSGTVLVQLEAGNADRALKPGGYAQVRFPVATSGALTLPASALLVREDGIFVAVADATSHIHIKPVSVSRDEGATVQISTGVAAGDRVIDAPPDAIAEGDPVRIDPARAAAQE